MKLLISTSSMKPIYEQIVEQVRRQIEDGGLKPQSLLPSVRAVAREHHISALTVKKAYDQLESEGLVRTVQGKGTYVADIDAGYVDELRRTQIEKRFEKEIAAARAAGMKDGEILEMVSLLLEVRK